MNFIVLIVLFPFFSFAQECKDLFIQPLKVRTLETPSKGRVQYATATVYLSEDLVPESMPRRKKAHKVFFASKDGQIWIYNELHKVTDPVTKMADYVNFVRTIDPERFPFPKGEFISTDFEFNGGNIKGKIRFDYTMSGTTLVSLMLKELNPNEQKWGLVIEYKPGRKSKVKNLKNFIEMFVEYTKSIPTTKDPNLIPYVFRPTMWSRILGVRASLAAKMGFDIKKIAAETNIIRSRFLELLRGPTHQMMLALSLKSNNNTLELNRILALYDAPREWMGDEYKRVALVKYFSQSPVIDSSLLWQTLKDYTVDIDLYSRAFQQFIIEESLICTPLSHVTEGLFFHGTNDSNILRVYGKSLVFTDPHKMLRHESINGNFGIKQISIFEKREELGNSVFPLEFVAELKLP